MKITTDIHQLLYSIRTNTYSSYRMEERATGLFVLLLHSREEMLFELNEPVDAQMKAKIRLVLEDFKKYITYKVPSPI